jgi:midasin
MQTPYDKFVYETVEFSDELAGEMKNFIHEHEKPRYIGNFASGKKLNLRKAMQSEARFQLSGEFDPDIWLRREDPQKRDHQFIFVMDESGSMRDANKWDNTLKGLVLCQESLNELEIDFGVIGFSDEPQIHKNLEDKFDENFRNQELNQIMNSHSGGTNDADALKIALEMLRNSDPEKQKTIIFMTDGEGKKEEMKRLIEEADQDGIRIIGVGIGSGTEGVVDVFKYNVQVDRLAQLPAKLADLVREQLEDGYEG